MGVITPTKPDPVTEAALSRALNDELADKGFVVAQLDKLVAWARTGGWSAQELVGRMPPFPDWAPEDVAANMVAFNAMLAGGDPAASTEIVALKSEVASLKSVVTKEKNDSMQSFLFAETFKYFYLLFAPPRTLNFDKVVFNTEAHPLRKTW